jgi:hypothetical protein
MGYRDKLVHDPRSGKIVADAAFNLNPTSIGEVVSDPFFDLVLSCFSYEVLTLALRRCRFSDRCLRTRTSAYNAFPFRRGRWREIDLKTHMTRYKPFGTETAGLDADRC